MLLRRFYTYLLALPPHNVLTFVISCDLAKPRLICIASALESSTMTMPCVSSNTLTKIPSHKLGVSLGRAILFVREEVVEVVEVVEVEEIDRLEEWL